MAAEATTTNTATNAELIKIKKDALISALFSLSKAAQESSSATIDFFNALNVSSENAPSIGNLAQALGAAASELQSVAVNTEGLASEKEPETPTKDAKRKRAKKAPVDPNAPKKPNTIYFAFASDARKKIREEREKKGEPALSNAEMTHEISKRWHQLSDGEKQPWKDQYQKEMEKYNEDKKAYQEGRLPNGNGGEAAHVAEESPKKKQKQDSHEEEKKQEEEQGDSETPKSAKKKKSKSGADSPEKTKKDKKEKKKKRKSEGGNTSVAE
ncbi:hypothetical protein TRICI_005453 [Trichomonascus ciferrii]|uniref:HMG box domain-containing protein n=1 Tax=Trichomonascus ciferrii TaxID=44093 RepID=A0A642UUH1_9ASCO|nr:hypothetical protein TRICI_005453 [Trichomonascus ciferrii]